MLDSERINMDAQAAGLYNPASHRGEFLQPAGEQQAAKIPGATRAPASMAYCSAAARPFLLTKPAKPDHEAYLPYFCSRAGAAGFQPNAGASIAVNVGGPCARRGEQ
ncbi:MAG: hypothetical protein KDA41_12940 [Planctomycetales bacterium]|nr:hypothetical protein [Planctomycetales bacterium]